MFSSWLSDENASFQFHKKISQNLLSFKRTSSVFVLKKAEVSSLCQNMLPEFKIKFLPVVTSRDGHVAKRRDWTAESDYTAWVTIPCNNCQLFFKPITETKSDSKSFLLLRNINQVRQHLQASKADENGMPAE